MQFVLRPYAMKLSAIHINPHVLGTRGGEPSLKSLRLGRE
jgi:hypothetical protein